MASKQIGGLTAGTPIMADVIPKQIADASTEAEKVTFQQVSDLILPYRIYVAKITQSGTSAPSATVLQNTLGGTPVWSRTGQAVERCAATSTRGGRRATGAWPRCLASWSIGSWYRISALAARRYSATSRRA